MNLYAESSAVLAWLLGEPRGHEIRRTLARADLIVASDLTLVECDRVLVRAHTLGELAEAAVLSLRRVLGSASAHWNLLRVDEEVVERARRPFPGEPIRALDALHLASALVATSAFAQLAMLSLDEAVRTSARGLGLVVVPRAARGRR